MAEKGAYPPLPPASAPQGGFPEAPPSYDATMSGAAGKEIKYFRFGVKFQVEFFSKFC